MGRLLPAMTQMLTLWPAVRARERGHTVAGFLFGEKCHGTPPTNNQQAAEYAAPTSLNK